MKNLKLFLILSCLLLFLAGAVSLDAVDYQSARAARDRLVANYPLVQFYNDGSSITRIYGQAFGTGAGPVESAESFRIAYAPLFGLDSEELRPESFVLSEGNSQQVMYDEESGASKFTLIYYSQYRDGIPVYKSDLRLLVRNEPGYPLVLAASSLRDLGDFRVDPGRAIVSPEAVRAAFNAANPQYVEYGETQMVVWAGFNEMKTDPTLAVTFVADDGQKPTTNRFRFFIDPLTGEILYQQDMIIKTDVSGQVRGNATENFKSEQCGNEISTALPYSRVYITSGSPAYADSLGNFTIPNGGTSPVTVTSHVRGRYFAVTNNGSANSLLTQTVTPPGPANFLHNPSNIEYTRAEVNGYLHANVVRDYTLKYNPTYPVIYNQLEFPVYVNDNDYFYCPGNAWYDGSSLTFCRAGSGYPNTAFSTVIHHEYGHHLVEMAGSGQEEYGEGMGDVMGLLITDDPGAAWGFFGSCTEPLRNADNTMQYPCTGEIHECGQLLSGCVWSTRNELLSTNPATYRSILSNLAINALLLHTGSTIAPDITIDYLTLDDNDGDIYNGTPHYNEICTGFGDHNMDCPPLSLLSFSYPSGRPEFVNPSGGTTMRVVVTGVSGTPQPNTGVLHYNTGSGWLTAAMTQVSPNVYDAVFPATTCRTTVMYYVSAQSTSGYTVNDPTDAPTTYFTTISGTGIVTLYSTDFSTSTGWTGLGGSGEWAIGAAAGGQGNDSYGGPDPSIDHSPSTDNGILGNDITPGTGGDYAASLTSTVYATSPIINCAGQGGIRLSFWRWLGVERNTYDHGYFQVYNGSTWTTLFENGSTTIDEGAWSQYTYDVSTYAYNNPNFQFRFGIGATDGSWQYCGWNIDDIVVSAIQCDTVVTGTIAGTVTDVVGPVGGAIVHATGSGNSYWDTTASNGAYSVAARPATYSVAFTHIDHRDTTITGVVVTSSNTTTVNVTMQRLPGAIKGTVTAQGGGTLANVRVVAVGSGREDTTGSNGIYLITGLVDGSYSVQFTLADYRDTTITGVTVTPGDTTFVNVAMRLMPGWIIGSVRDSIGAPIESVAVIINAMATQLASADRTIHPPGINLGSGDGTGDIPILLSADSVYTDSLGFYSSRALSAAAYSVLFRHSLYHDTTITGVTVTPNDTSNVSPNLRKRNRAPVITSPAAAEATEEIFFSYVAAASDSDGVIPTITLSDHPGWLSLVGDTLAGTPLEGDTSATFKIIASDGYLADTLLVALTVIPVNDPPVLTSRDTATTMENMPFIYTATAIDPDNSPTFSFVNYPVWLLPSGADIAGVPPEAAPETSFVVIASDGALADTMTVVVTVLHVNDPPVITSPAAAEATEDVPFNYIATASDPEGMPLTIAIDSLSAWLSVLGDTVSGTPPEGTPDGSFRIIASDSLLADTLFVIVIVVPVNDPPTVTSPDTATATEHQPFSYTATASDPDDSTLAISFAGYPDWLLPINDVISGTPPEGSVSTTFNVIASDGFLADTLTVDLTVIPVNDPPVIISPDSATATEEEFFSYLGNAIDPEQEPFIINYADYPSWLTPGDASIGGTPPLGAPDTTFKVVAFDGELADTLVVSIAVVEGNHAPIVTSPDTATAVEDEPFFYTASATDPDGPAPEISILHIAGWMSLDGDIVSGTPGEGRVDTSFTIIASDGLLADTLVVAVDLLPVNDRPMVTSPASGIASIGEQFEYVGAGYDPEGTDLIFGYADYPSWLTPLGEYIGGVPPAGSVDTTFMVIASDGELDDTLLVTVTIEGGCPYMPGDINNNGSANGIDVVYGVNYFKGGPDPIVICSECPQTQPFYAAGDVNGNCAFNGIDVTFFVNFLKGIVPTLVFCPDCPPGSPVVSGGKADIAAPADAR